VQGVSDAKLRGVATRGLAMGDPPRARRAADLWLTFRAAGGEGPLKAA
jgi:hypothetical protein